jgi:hypothetical protein
MKKLKNVKVFEINENKFDKFIFGIIESNESGDWNEYEEGEEIVYNCDVRDEEWLDLDFNIDSLENYINEGISYINEGDDNFVNVEMKDWYLVISSVN